MSLPNETRKRIDDYKEQFDGDLQKAIAAELYSPFIVQDCLGVPVWAEADKMAELEAAFLNQEPEQPQEPGQNEETGEENKVSIATQGEGAATDPAENTATDQNEATAAETEKSAENLTDEVKPTDAAEAAPANDEEEATPDESESSKRVFTDSDLLQIVLEANKTNRTIGEVITEKLYGENPQPGEVNKRRVAYYKGLITTLLSGEVEEAAPTEETPTETATNENAAETVTNSES